MRIVSVILNNSVILNGVKDLGVIISFLFLLVPSAFASSTTSRLTLPVSTNATLVVSTTGSSVDKKILVTDHLSSTRVILNEDGTKSSDISYYPYGSNFNEFPPVSTNINDRYYTGQRKIDNSSLYNYNARFYNPTIGVFTQPDTVEGPNRFAYVGGNPITFADKSGNDKLDLTMIDEGRAGSSIHATGIYDPDLVDKDIPENLVYTAAVFSGGALALAAAPEIAIGAFNLCLAQPLRCSGAATFGADVALGDALPPGASMSPASGMRAAVQGSMGRFVADESGTFFPLMGKASNELTDVSDELVASWGAPRMARLKAPAEFREDLLRILKGESPALVYADTGRPIAIPQKAIDLISSRLGSKGMRDQRLMREFSDTVYQLSQDPYHPGLRSHKLGSNALDFISSSINGDWRLAWNWTKIDVLTVSGEFEKVGAIQLLTVGQHSGGNAIYH